jgi:hypothetical protein
MIRESLLHRGHELIKPSVGGRDKSAASSGVASPHEPRRRRGLLWKRGRIDATCRPAEIHLVDGGHWALETNLTDVVPLMRDFLNRIYEGREM